MAIRKSRSQMVMTSAEIAAVYESWGKEDKTMGLIICENCGAETGHDFFRHDLCIACAEAERRATETLEQIADRVAPQGGKQAAMKAAKAKAKQAAYAASRPQPEPVEPTQAQRDAFTEYVAAREEWEGLRDDIAFANSFAEQDVARTKLRDATGRYHAARKEAERLGILEDARRLFR